MPPIPYGTFSNLLLLFSVSASLSYMKKGRKSEVNKFRALMPEHYENEQDMKMPATMKQVSFSESSSNWYVYSSLTFFL